MPYIQIMNYQKVKLRKQFTLQLNQESKITRDKFNQGGEKNLYTDNYRTLMKERNGKIFHAHDWKK